MLRRTKRGEELAPAGSRLEGKTLAPRDPFSLWWDIDRLFEDFRSAFDDLFWTPSGAYGKLAAMTRQPLMDIEDTGKEYKITMDMPGIKKEDVNIEVTPTSIEISAETSKEEKEEGRNFLRRERSEARYYRCLEIPEEVVPDKVEARMENGVLEVILPKKEVSEEKKRKVAVK